MARVAYVSMEVALDERMPTYAASLFDTLERVILPMFHQRRDDDIDVMRHAVSLNGSFFNSHPMVEEYQ